MFMDDGARAYTCEENDHCFYSPFFDEFSGWLVDLFCVS